MAQHLPTGSETTPPYAPRCSRFGSEPLSVEDDVDVWRYAILELHARNDDDDNAMTLLVGSHKIITEVICVQVDVKAYYTYTYTAEMAKVCWSSVVGKRWLQKHN